MLQAVCEIHNSNLSNKINNFWLGWGFLSACYRRYKCFYFRTYRGYNMLQSPTDVTMENNLSRVIAAISHALTISTTRALTVSFLICQFLYLWVSLSFLAMVAGFFQFCVLALFFMISWLYLYLQLLYCDSGSSNRFNSHS